MRVFKFWTSTLAVADEDLTCCSSDSAAVLAFSVKCLVSYKTLQDGIGETRTSLTQLASQGIGLLQSFVECLLVLFRAILT